MKRCARVVFHFFACVPKMNGLQNGSQHDTKETTGRLNIAHCI